MSPFSKVGAAFANIYAVSPCFFSVKLLCLCLLLMLLSAFDSCLLMSWCLLAAIICFYVAFVLLFALLH